MSTISKDTPKSTHPKTASTKVLAQNTDIENVQATPAPPRPGKHDPNELTFGHQVDQSPEADEPMTIIKKESTKIHIDPEDAAKVKQLLEFD